MQGTRSSSNIWDHYTTITDAEDPKSPAMDTGGVIKLYTKL